MKWSRDKYSTRTQKRFFNFFTFNFFISWENTKGGPLFFLKKLENRFWVLVKRSLPKVREFSWRCSFSIKKSNYESQIRKLTCTLCREFWHQNFTWIHLKLACFEKLAAFWDTNDYRFIEIIVNSSAEMCWLLCLVNSHMNSNFCERRHRSFQIKNSF